MLLSLCENVSLYAASGRYAEWVLLLLPLRVLLQFSVLLICHLKKRIHNEHFEAPPVFFRVTQVVFETVAYRSIDAAAKGYRSNEIQLAIVVGSRR